MTYQKLKYNRIDQHFKIGKYKDKDIARVGTWAMLFLGKPEASHLMLNTKLEHQKEDEG